jgi:hypothetical protein
MAKKESLLDQLRTYLEGVENYWVAFATVLVTGIMLAVITLTGVYFYTHH